MPEVVIVQCLTDASRETLYYPILYETMPSTSAGSGLLMLHGSDTARVPLCASKDTPMPYCRA